MKFLKLLVLFIIMVGPNATFADDTTVAKDAPKTAYPYILQSKRNPFYKGTTYKFETKNTSMNWRAIANARVQLPVLEVGDNRTLTLYTWTSLGGFYAGKKSIGPKNRSDFYHNGIVERDGKGGYFYQMIERRPSGREVIAGWVSDTQLVAPMRPSLLSQTEANYAPCKNCSPIKWQSLDDVVKLVPKTRLPMNEPPRAPYKYACPIHPEYATRVTSKFKIRKHPITGVVRPHKGMDFGQDKEKGLPPIMNIYKGTVLKSGLAGGFGMQVVVKTVEGLIITYNHLSKGCKLPALGASLVTGQKVGCMGNTGMSEAPHLHLEVYPSEAHYEKKEAVNPQTKINLEKACEDVAVMPDA